MPSRPLYLVDWLLPISGRPVPIIREPVTRAAALRAMRAFEPLANGGALVLRRV